MTSIVCEIGPGSHNEGLAGGGCCLEPIACWSVRTRAKEAKLRRSGAETVPAKRRPAAVVVRFCAPLIAADLLCDVPRPGLGSCLSRRAGSGKLSAANRISAVMTPTVPPSAQCEVATARPAAPVIHTAAAALMP